MVLSMMDPILPRQDSNSFHPTDEKSGGTLLCFEIFQTSGLLENLNIAKKIGQNISCFLYHMHIMLLSLGMSTVE
jgi:hypothetical protein